MRIELTNEDSKAVIAAEGAIVELYRVGDQDVLFPRQEVDGKMRGGSHVCAPYFGPGVHSGQSQHGYGRDVEWSVSQQVSSGVTLSHLQTAGEYEGLAMELKYFLGASALSMELTLRNASDRVMRLTPGFHPYFACGESGDVSVNGETYSESELAETVYRNFPDGMASGVVGGQTYGVSSDTLREYAIWSSHPNLFVCIEPTLAANSFSELSEGSDIEYISPGEMAKYDCSISRK